ncbi:hypothetical protein Q31b_00270 [Novipirellula aureliae]|uniref:Uncharacterized protein n=1 Tax=Novipirellula aureliae TaxID=2527966 RepID=A0A5C6EA62_9BACT|nr:hypothetical protein Q31b_00270 [Novipirellula aureliae]
MEGLASEKRTVFPFLCLEGCGRTEFVPLSGHGGKSWNGIHSTLLGKRHRQLLSNIGTDSFFVPVPELSFPPEYEYHLYEYHLYEYHLIEGEYDSFARVPENRTSRRLATTGS